MVGGTQDIPREVERLLSNPDVYCLVVDRHPGQQPKIVSFMLYGSMTTVGMQVVHTCEEIRWLTFVTSSLKEPRPPRGGTEGGYHS